MVKHPVCDDRFHDAHQRDDITNKNRQPCPTCGGTWVDFGMARYETCLLMNDDATVTELTRCDDCGFLFRDIEKHVAESVTVSAVDQCEFVGEAETEGGLPGYMLFRCILPAGHDGTHRRKVHGEPGP